jgi:hypothetical protein
MPNIIPNLVIRNVTVRGFPTSAPLTGVILMDVGSPPFALSIRR